MKTKSILLQSGIFFLIVLLLFDFNVRFLISQPLFYLLGGALFISALLLWKYSKQLRSLQPFRTAIIAILCVGMVFAIHGPSLQAQWGVIDDHEIMIYLGTDGKMDLSEWPPMFWSTEISSPGQTSRFRPTYPALRLLESALWDNNPQYWYATRLAILTLFLISVWLFSSKYIGTIGGGLLAAFILTSTYWADIVTRLGPSEIYVALGLAPMFFALPRILDTQARWPAWLLLTIGYIMAVGAKENMVLLGLPLLFLTVYLWFSKKFTTSVIISLIVMFSWTLFTTWAIGTAMLSAGQDVYGRSTTTASRLDVAILSLKTNQVKEMGITVILAVALLVFSYFKARPLKLTQPTLLFLGVILTSMLIFISQFVFYNASWPDHNRYDFPGLLYVPLNFIALVIFIRTLLQKTSFHPQIITAMTWAVYVGVVLVIVMRGLVSTQVRVSENVVRTNAHTGRIAALAEILNQNPEKQVIFESTNVWDYEPIHSYHIFLRTYGVSNPLFLRIHNYDASTVNQGLEESLAAELVQRSLEGNASFLPISDVDLTNCYSIQLSGEVDTTCEVL